MANINLFIPFLLKWEGGFVNDPLDLGGATNMGVTLKTWQRVGYDKNGDDLIDEEDLKLIFRQDLIESVLRPHYWDRWQADRIINQSIAHILVDWLWMSGMVGIKTPQQILQVEADGIVGPKTLAAINNHPSQEDLFETIKSERKAYIEKICLNRPANKRFKKGWLNRLADIKFTAMILWIVLCFGFSACKSAVPAVIQSHSEVKADSKKESQQISGSQTHSVDWTQSELQSQETIWQETLIIKFDSCCKDSITGMYPVKEILMSHSIRKKESQSTQVDVEQESRNQSNVELVQEQSERLEKETTQSRFPPKLKQWHLLIFLIALNCIFAYLFFCKK